MPKVDSSLLSVGGHTPGPWLHEHRKGADGMYRTEVFSETHGGIATCDWTPKHCGQGVTTTYREANARLIATSPKLLAALTRLCRSFPTDSDMAEAGWDATEIEEACSAYDEARAVVQEATGEVSQ